MTLFNDIKTALEEAIEYERKNKMKLYKITVKQNQGYDCYNGFIIVANTIPEALEKMYYHICRTDNKNVFDDIPYYLRSSNLDIKTLGSFIPDENFEDCIIMVDYTEG